MSVASGCLSAPLNIPMYLKKNTLQQVKKALPLQEHNSRLADFAKPGNYLIPCILHSFFGMTGKKGEHNRRQRSLAQDQNADDSGIDEERASPEADGAEETRDPGKVITILTRLCRPCARNLIMPREIVLVTTSMRVTCQPALSRWQHVTRNSMQVSFALC